MKIKNSWICHCTSFSIEAGQRWWNDCLSTMVGLPKKVGWRVLPSRLHWRCSLWIQARLMHPSALSLRTKATSISQTSSSTTTTTTTTTKTTTTTTTNTLHSIIIIATMVIATAIAIAITIHDHDHDRASWSVLLCCQCHEWHNHEKTLLTKSLR